MERLSTFKKHEHIDIREYFLAAAIKALARTSFGEEYFKSNKECIELANAYDIVRIFM